MDVGLLILRLVVGLFFVVHGTQKLFGWFGGYGLKGTGQFFESLGYRPGRFMALIAGTAEAGGGLLLAAGLLTPLGAAAIIGVMINAVLSAKLSQGLIGGWELDLAYATAGVALAFTGAGAYSLDAFLGWDFADAVWGIAAIALGVATAALALVSRGLAKRAIREVQRQAA
jgi:putative oxidoreductase